MVQKWLKQVYKSGRRDEILRVLEKLMSGDRQGLDIEKMHGKNTLYRCRIGDFRIVISKEQGGLVKIIAVGSRGDVYKGL